MTRNLLIATAAIELATGVALLCFPSIVVRLLLGSQLESLPGLALGRVAGAALLALGVACWFAKSEGESSAARGIVIAMMLYNLGTVLILGVFGVRTQPTGIALWPAVALHGAMCAWCVASVLRKPSPNFETKD